MQVPEKLSLIGGSILLASTLVFTLKSQASNILPKVDSGMSSLMKTDQERQQDQQKQQQQQAFDNNFQQAQNNHWQTGQWGTAKFYVDNNENMHVGGGQLNGSFSSIVNDQQIKTISLEGNVQAPQDSSFLFADNNIRNIPLTQINGLPNLDTSQTISMYEMFDEIPSLSSLDVSHFNTHNVNSMEYMFYGDGSLSNLDISHFDTHNVNNMEGMFAHDVALSNLDISHFDTHNVTNMEDMFYSDSSLNKLDLSHFDTHNVNDMESMFDSDSSLSSLDLSHFDTHNVTNMEDMFADANIHQLSLGPNTQLQNTNNSNYDTYLSGNYQSNGQTSNLTDGNAHPGTWIKQ